VIKSEFELMFARKVTALGYSAVSGKAAWLFFVIFNLLAVIVLFKYTATLLQSRDAPSAQAHAYDTNHCGDRLQ
jgi:hypothetical protein